jgi:hypothetical protein
MNLRHPITSWDLAICLYGSPSPRQILCKDLLPLPCAYWRIHLLRTGSVSISFIHVPIKLIDIISASTLPAWLQSRTCPHVSRTCWQLGQVGSRSVSHGLLPFAAAIPITCLHAQIWKRRGTPWSAAYTNSQSTRSNPSVRILAS